MGLFRRGSDQTSDAAPSPATDGSIAGAADSPDSQMELQQLRDTVEEIHRVIVEVADRGSAQEKVFDTLHAELQDYKNDFIYEHLKPVLWPLLFLFDSLEQYAREIVGRVNNTGESTIDAKEILDHLKFFRGQLVESLRICEVTPMKQPSGAVDPKLHKPIGTETVQDPGEDNTVRRVVRTGWYLNGKVLRHAEVIVGKSSGVSNLAGEKSKDTVIASRRDLAARLQAPRASSDASASGGGRGS
ncbi:MAG TPA: nucleotide exchange factor GrpE [Abditibacteriaceae bacterium]|jgi:molecular chaperone GrpE